MSGHTPGPWRVEGRLILACDERETVICEVTGSPKNEAVKADARLIAAAPDLLEALNRAEGFVDMETACSCVPGDEPCVLCAVRAALARAEGR